MSVHALKGQGRSRARGQALVEFAMVAPIFFLLLFGVIEGGRFIYYYQTLNNATREGARYAIVHGSNSTLPSGPMPPGSSKPTADLPGANVQARVRSTAIGMEPGGITFPAIDACPSSPDAVNPCWYSNNGRSQTVKVLATYTYTTLIPLPLPSISVQAESTLVVNN